MLELKYTRMALDKFKTTMTKNLDTVSGNVLYIVYTFIESIIAGLEVDLKERGE